MSNSNASSSGSQSFTIEIPETFRESREEFRQSVSAIESLLSRIPWAEGCGVQVEKDYLYLFYKRGQDEGRDSKASLYLVTEDDDETLFSDLPDAEQLDHSIYFHQLLDGVRDKMLELNDEFKSSSLRICGLIQEFVGALKSSPPTN